MCLYGYWFDDAGPAHPDGLYLESKRIRDGLEATILIPATYCAFPGIVNGGIVTTLMDCHGNWCADQERVT